MADWILDMSDAVEAAEQQRVQQDEAATQPATTPRNLDSQVQERPVILPTPPPAPQADRPEYDNQGEQRWSHPAAYYLDYPSERTGTDYHQELEQAQYAHMKLWISSL